MAQLVEPQAHPRRPRPGPNWSYRRQGFSNLLRMGHCAPTVMQTLLDVSSAEEEWLVKLSAGMPGGIGNTGHECGGVTSPLVLMGIQHGLGETDRGLPTIFDRGHALSRSFLACHGTLQCREIRGNDRFPRHCIGPVLRAPELYRDALDGIGQDVIPAGTRAGYARLYAHLVDNGFHCAQAVLIQLGYSPDEDRELFDATSAFMGGTLFMGGTCSAYAAGVMAMGLQAGEIENSRPRVVRLLALMTVGGDAFDDRLNKFNPSMNRGYRLSRWFANEFGSTQCRKITGCDFSDPKGVSDYAEGGQVTRCRAIGCQVAEKVRELLGQAGAECPPTSAGGG
jgi:Putative redox-active protein (C_GCAxxG_C_C)